MVNLTLNRLGNRLAVFPTMSPYLWPAKYSIRSDGRPSNGILFDGPSQQYVPLSPFEIERALGKPIGYTAHARIPKLLRASHLAHMVDDRLITFLAEITKANRP